MKKFKVGKNRIPRSGSFLADPRNPAQYSGSLPRDAFRDTADANVDFGYFVPGFETDDAVRREFEDTLKGFDSLFCLRSEYAVLGHFRNEWIRVRNDIQMLLHLPNLFSGAADLEVISRPGGGHSRNNLAGIDKNRIPVIIPQYLNRRVAAVSEGF